MLYRQKIRELNPYFSGFLLICVFSGNAGFQVMVAREGWVIYGRKARSGLRFGQSAYAAEKNNIP